MVVFVRWWKYPCGELNPSAISYIDLGDMFLGKEPNREGSCSKNQLQANTDEFCQWSLLQNGLLVLCHLWLVWLPTQLLAALKDFWEADWGSMVLMKQPLMHSVPLKDYQRTWVYSEIQACGPSAFNPYQCKNPYKMCHFTHLIVEFAGKWIK